MANNDSSSYTLRFNEVSSILEYSSGLSWITVPGLGGGSPGGADTQVQFNDSGSFGGSSDLTWDGTSLKALTLESSQLNSTTDLTLAPTGDLIVDATGDVTVNHNIELVAENKIDLTGSGVNFLSSFPGDPNGALIQVPSTVGSISLANGALNDSSAFICVNFSGANNDIRYTGSSHNFHTAAGGAILLIDNEADAALEIDSVTQGFLPPRMTTTQRDAITSPSEGLVIYNTTTHVLNFYNGTTWGAV